MCGRRLKANDAGGTKPDTKQSRRRRQLALVAALMSALVVVGVVNFVLVKILYVAFRSGGNEINASVANQSLGTSVSPSNSSFANGSQYSFFVNQAINFLYIIFGAFLVYPRMLCTNDITPEMRKTPHRIFLMMALLDSFGTFFISMGAVYTPGQIQPLLNQALIPLTMAFSCILVKARYNAWELVGALLMLVGAAVSVVPTLTDSDDENAKWYACLIYFCSNIPMAASCVYKESIFRKRTIDVWYMANWISIYQFLISFIFVPLLVVPFIGGTETGITFPEIWTSFRDGALCWLEILPACSGENSRGQLWLLPGFTVVNMSYTGLALFVTKYGTAVLSRLACALILPLTAVAFALPFLGPTYQEQITVYTMIGLGVTLAGFMLYTWATEVYRKKLEAAKLAEALNPSAGTMLRSPLLEDDEVGSDGSVHV
eukprot:INCI7278.1.p1 GENE.INCI7278.1~~INCI7278.1.p1  ORF type:complete len:431 (-),score=48.87 INCI7278.1:634-1926(-)